MRAPENIAQLNLLDIDYMGLIFHEQSSRFINGKVPLSSGGISRIGVFVDKEPKHILAKASEYSLDGIQLHGQESPEVCGRLKASGLTVIKAIPVKEELPTSILPAYEDQCDYFLFDTKGKLPGGNGVRFSWSLLADYNLSTPFFLSGGICLEDAQEIANLKHDRLYAVDINSRFEIRPALKDINQISKFISTLNS